MRTVFLVLAAGRGRRFGGKKQWLELKGKPLVAYSLEVLDSIPEIDEIYLGVSSEDVEIAESLLRKYAPSKGSRIYEGGRERADTVYNGLKLIDGFADVVGIHDAARPFISRSLVKRLLSTIKSEEVDGVIPVVPVFDTVKEVESEFVVCTLDRDRVFRVQTPQVFRVDSLVSAYEKAFSVSRYFTDDAAVVEFWGGKVKAVEGDRMNFKVTTEEDFIFAERMLMKPRVGLGYDIHRIGEGEGVFLGGVFIPCGFSLQGHSDADVVIHALVDALLGAVSLGDIGEWFPDTDEDFRGKESSYFLRKIMPQVKKRGDIANVDITVIAEKPKLSGYKNKIRKNLANLMEISVECINVKAKTKEGLGEVGKGEAIECWVSVLIL